MTAMNRFHPLSTLVALALAVALPSTAFAGSREAADVLTPADPHTGDRTVYAADGASVIRGERGITASVSMPTPAPGSYVYPDGPTASGVP